MTPKEMILAMITATNKAVLDQYKVVLTVSNITLTDPTAGSFQNDTNTIVSATSTSAQVKGSNSYYYNRLDMTAAFAEIGASPPTVDLTVVNISTVLNALKAKYNFNLDPNDVISASYVGDQYMFTVSSLSYIWLNSLTVTIAPTSGDIDMVIAFPNNMLVGFTYEGPLPG